MVSNEGKQQLHVADKCASVNFYFYSELLFYLYIQILPLNYEISVGSGNYSPRHFMCPCVFCVWIVYMIAFSKLCYFKPKRNKMIKKKMRMSKSSPLVIFTKNCFQQSSLGDRERGINKQIALNCMKNKTNQSMCSKYRDTRI